MREAVAVLRLNRQHITHLLTHLVAYRSYLWKQVLPTPERNQIIRTIQVFQGRLEPLQASGQEQGTLPLSKEEGSMLKHLLTALLKHYAAASPARSTQALSDIAGLHVLVERSLRKA